MYVVKYFILISKTLGYLCYKSISKPRGCEFKSHLEECKYSNMLQNVRTNCCFKLNSSTIQLKNKGMPTQRIKYSIKKN